ncbi:hypothetical protein [Deinococcus hopiensis]|nr:hypothetical protein [Deinococcus hopiensis]
MGDVDLDRRERQIAVTGASGNVGREVMRELPTRGEWASGRPARTVRPPS